MLVDLLLDLTQNQVVKSTWNSKTLHLNRLMMDLFLEFLIKISDTTFMAYLTLFYHS